MIADDARTHWSKAYQVCLSDNIGFDSQFNTDNSCGLTPKEAIMDEYREVLSAAHEMGQDYLADITGRRVAPDNAALAGLSAFDQPLPVGPGNPVETLELLNRAGGPATIASSGGRYFGFVTGGVLPAAAGANWLAGAWDQLAFNETSSPTSIKLEAVAGRWILELLGLPAGSTVSFVTGSTMAHFTCLAAARAEMLRRQGYDLRAKGLRGAPPLRIIVSGEIHITVHKVLCMLGFGSGEVEVVPADDQGRMRADLLPQLDSRCIVICQAGNVNSGAFDPFEAICWKARAAGAWVHVDGAFGLWGRVTPSLDAQTAGIHQADSWTVDSHKWLNTPMDCGLAVCRDPEAVRRVMSTDAAYIRTGAALAPKDITPEFGRRARGIEVWATLHSLGRAGVRDMIERCCAHARRFAEGLEAMGFEVLNDVVLNQVVATIGGPGEIAQVMADVQASGECWFGPTHWQGRDAVRISVASWRTTEADVDRSLAAIERAVRAVVAKVPA